MPSLSPAPHFDLQAIVTGRRINPQTCASRAVLLIFHNQNTLDAVREVQEAVRTHYSDPNRLQVVNIVELSGVPRLLRSAVETLMRAGYKQGISHVPVGLDPADYVIILPDWQGEVTQAFRMTNVGKQAGLALIDGQWRLCARYQGSGLGARAIEMVSQLIVDGSEKGK